MAGGGVSGQMAFGHPPTGSPRDQQNHGSIQDLALSPGVAPWAAGRVGIAGENEGGLTYAGRSIRIDARHAFAFGKAALSVGLGASAILPHSPSGGNAKGVWGGGADVPVLIGVRSVADIVSFWFGPRAGFEIFSGQVQLSDFAGGSPLFDVQGKQFYAGLTTGARVGFRHVHVALELNASYHAADGSFRGVMPMGAGPAPGSASTSVQQLSLTPAGALEITF